MFIVYCSKIIHHYLYIYTSINQKIDYLLMMMMMMTIMMMMMMMMMMKASYALNNGLGLTPPMVRQDVIK